jgi:hypothetical protein
MVGADELTIVPATLDLGRLSLAGVKPGLTTLGRVGVRRRLGSFKLKNVSTNLPFLAIETQTMIPDRNYVIRITLAPGAEKIRGEKSGSLYIETDDPKRPRVEVPIRMVMTE